MTKRRKFGERLGGPVFFRAWKDWEEGDYVVGTIVSHSLDKKYKRTNYHIKVEEMNFEVENQNGDPLEVGGVLVLNGTGLLKKHLGCLKDDNAVEKGTCLRLEYEGEAEITGGDWEGEKAHSIAIQFAEEEESTTDDDDGMDL